MKQLEGKPIRVTEFIHGPFVIYVSSDSDSEITQVVSPPGGFPGTAEALTYIEREFANRKTPYLGMRFDIVQIVTPHEFNAFCSWEE
jgi:hypothetical protein